MRRIELVRKLELVQQGLGDLSPLFGTFIFEKDSISAYNGIVAVIAEGSVGGEPFATAGKPLLGLLQNTYVDDIELSLDEHDVMVTAGKSTVKLPYFKASEFVFRQPNEQWGSSFELGDDVLNGLEVCLTTVSRDQTQPAIMGVCFNFAAKQVFLFSCDGDAVTRYSASTKVAGVGAYTVPNAFCDTLLKVCRETGVTTGSMQFNDNWAKATLSNGYVIYGHMIVNDTPLDHAGVLADSLQGDEAFVPVPLGLNEALARARVLADPESGKTLLTVTKGKLKLNTVTSLGDLRDEVSIKGHPDVEAVTHASLVQRSLTVCDEISIRDRVTAYRGKTVLQVVANIGA